MKLQPQQEGARGRPTSASNRQPAATQLQTQEPPSPTSSSSSSGHHQQEVAEEESPPEVPAPPPPPAAALRSQKSIVKPPVTETSTEPASSEAEAMQIEPAPSLVKQNSTPLPDETILEETIRVTRGRLRKSRTVPK